MNTGLVPRPRPFLPSDLARPDQALIRACVTKFICFAHDQPEALELDLARRVWPRDATTEALIERAAVVPTSSTTAAALAGQAVAGFVASLAPAHAGARLIGAGLAVPLN